MQGRFESYRGGGENEGEACDSQRGGGEIRR